MFYWERLYSCSFFRGFSIPTCARPVGTLPSFRARCAMAARCPCSATASRIPSKPSSALPATRTACSRVGAAASEDVQCLSQQSRSESLDRNCSTGSDPEHSSTPLPQPLLVKTAFLIKILYYVALLLFRSYFYVEFDGRELKWSPQVNRASASWLFNRCRRSFIDNLPANNPGSDVVRKDTDTGQLDTEDKLCSGKQAPNSWEVLIV